MNFGGCSVGANSLPIDPVKNINERFLPGMYGDFEETVTGRIAQLRTEEGWQSAEKLRFFEYLLDTVDRRKFRELRDSYLAPRRTEIGALKYLDPVSWFDDKFDVVFRLGLHEKPPMRILDIGTGPGHFLVLAQFYGHDATGTEIPDHRHPDGPTHLYNALSDIYGTKRIKHRISPMAPLDGIAGDYDLVTAFLAAFNRALGGHIWDRRDWDYFLAHLRQQVLAGDGAFFLNLVLGKRSDEIWNYLASLAEWNAADELLLYIRASAMPAEAPE